MKILRTRRAWSQERLADRAGVSAPAIARLEGGNARVATLSAVLSVLAPKARIRKPELAQWRAGTRDSRFTPQEVLDRVAFVIGALDLDPCAHPQSRVVARRYYFEEDDGLKQDWVGHTVFCNPPYGNADAFVRKAFSSWRAGHCKVVFLLLPVRTHTISFHEQIVGFADVFLLRGRIAFEGGAYKPTQASPFGNMIVFYGADPPMIARMLASFDCVHLPRNAAVGRAGQTCVSRDAAE